MKRSILSALIAFGTITALMVATLISRSGVPLARAATWNLVWNDEFNGSANTGVNTSNWFYDLGTGYGCGGCPNQWGTNEVESATNSPNNVYQDGEGHLNIKPILSGGSWTSGRIETQRTDFGAPAGGQMAVEASIQMPNVTGDAAAGYWPAFWMLGSSFRGVYTNWPQVGEIDIMENVNGINKEWGTLHCGYYGGGPCNEETGLSGQQPCSPTTCQAAFHTYRVEVDRSISPEEIRWYLDGVEFWHVFSNNPGMDATTWANAVDHNFFIILDVAMGGAFPAALGGGPTASTQSGIPLSVDYVRVYTSGGSTATPTATLTSTVTATATATPTMTPTPTPTPVAGGVSYEAEASGNTLFGGATAVTCTMCSGGQKVGFFGTGGGLVFNHVNAATTGSHTVTVSYLSGGTVTLIVNSDNGTSVTFSATGSTSVLGTRTLTMKLNAGENTIEFYTSTGIAPQFDRIVIS